MRSASPLRAPPQRQKEGRELSEAPWPSSNYACPLDDVLARKLVSLGQEGLLSEAFSEESLQRLGTRLDCSAEDRVYHNSCIFWLTGVISREFQVDRFYVAGQYGRRIFLGRPQIDLIVFVKSNNKVGGTPSADLLKKLHNFLNDQLSRFPDLCQISPIVEAPDQFLNARSPASMAKAKKLAQNRSLAVSKHSSPPVFAPDDYIRLFLGGAEFRIFIALALADDKEAQRQATYRLITQTFVSSGTQKIKGLHSCLVERSSAVIAKAPRELHFAIRLCQLWARCHRIDTLDPYAIEVLVYAMLQARKSATGGGSGAGARTDFADPTLAQVAEQQPRSRIPQRAATTTTSSDNSSADGPERSTPDPSYLVSAFQMFLQYCKDLKQVNLLNRIEAPANYVSPWPATADMPILTDNFDPYYNLLQSLSLEDEVALANEANVTLKQLERKDVTIEDIFLMGIPKKRKQSLSCWLLLLPLIIVGVCCVLVFYGKTDTLAVLQEKLNVLRGIVNPSIEKAKIQMSQITSDTLEKIKASLQYS